MSSMEKEPQAPGECAGHPVADIPIEDLRRSAAAAVAGAKDATIAGFQVTDDDDTQRTATRADLLELIGEATSRQARALAGDAVLPGAE
jgi:hypothetical protein